MSRSVMVMQILTKCGRCGALVEPNQMPSVLRGTNALFWRAVTTCNVDASGSIAMDFADSTVLCPDCVAQLNKWLAGGQTKDLSIAGDIIMDMYAALGAQPQREQACEYTTARRYEKCSECSFDPRQCVDDMFGDIRSRCAEIGIDLEEDEDAGK